MRSDKIFRDFMQPKKFQFDSYDNVRIADKKGPEDAPSLAASDLLKKWKSSGQKRLPASAISHAVLSTTSKFSCNPFCNFSIGMSRSSAAKSCMSACRVSLFRSIPVRSATTSSVSDDDCDTTVPVSNAAAATGSRQAGDTEAEMCGQLVGAVSEG